MMAFSRLAACTRLGQTKHFLTKAIVRLTAAAVVCCALSALPQQALAVNDDAVLKRMDSVLDENTRLREDFWKSRKAQGREGSRQAEEALAASDERVEKTRAEALAHVAGVSPAQVDNLRRDGRSWGQAAGELGVHPGFLGIGKTPMYNSLPKRKAPAAKATQSKTKRGAAVAGKSPAKASVKNTPAQKTPAKSASKAKQKTAAKEKTKTPAATAKKTQKAS